MTDDAPRWWGGPLDTERLALASVEAAADAVRRLARARGQRHDVSTSPAIVAASFAAIDHLRVAGRPAQGWAPLSGFVRARDGWVRLHGNYPHHANAVTRALGVLDRPSLDAAVAQRAAVDVERAVTEAGGVAVVVRSPEEWARHPHAIATAADPWVTVEESGQRPVPRTGVLPLGGVRVLDLTRVIAGPTCSQLLACLGADVLRVDPPGRPELLDQHLSNGMGKRSASADLGDAASDVARLLDAADVVLLGYRPGALARFGLHPDALVARHPGLVVGSLSAWGEHGPWGRRVGFDSIVQAACGIAVRCGDGERPGALPVQALDHASGYRLAAGVVDLLTRGRGGVVRVSLLGAARTLLGLAAPAPGPVDPPPVPLAEVASPHGRLRAVPPPLVLDGATIERPVGGYGAASLAWVPTR